MFDSGDLEALKLTIRLAVVSVLLLLIVGTPLAWWLSQSRSRVKTVLEAAVALPLVLPPTVIGFYLLLALGKEGFLGSVFYSLSGSSLAFTFAGLVIGSFIYSLPFVVQPLQSAFESVDKRQLEAAATLGASPVDRFFSIVIPQSRRGYLVAGVLGFAHTIGEFGVVLMIGGNIPGKTKVVSIAIYDHVETLNYSKAHWLSGALLLISFFLLLPIYFYKRKARKL